VPAAEIAGRILASKGESRLASRVITRTWKLSPHPDLALVYAYAKPGEPPRERLKRVKQLAALTPGDIEGPIAVATAAIEAHEWQDAREALAPYLEDRPPARICTLMARIETGELGDKGRAREWLARALRGPRDRAWIADGYVSDRWLPVSPVTGAVDAFEWKAPVDAIGRGDETLLIEEPAPVMREAQAPATLAPPRELAPAKQREEVVEVVPMKESVSPAETSKPAPISQAEPKAKPAIFVPERPPDDPGVGQTETDESPTSLERLRAAQIR
jgi:HemY protein